MLFDLKFIVVGTIFFLSAEQMYTVI